MMPVLYECAWFSIKSYGFCIALATGIGLWLAQKDNLLMELIPLEKLFDLTSYLIVGGVVGGRILFLLESDSTHSFFQACAVWQGGLSVSGALFSAISIALFYLTYHKIPLLPALDHLAIYVSLIYSISRLGCFFAGCCHGIVTTHNFSICYTHPLSLAATQEPVIPTQLLSSALLFILFLFLYHQKNNSHAGKITSYFLFYIGLERFFIDFIRYDHQPLFLFFSHTQLLSSLFIVASRAIMFYNARHKSYW